ATHTEVARSLLQMERPRVVVVLARELVVEGREALIGLGRRGQWWLHRVYDPSTAAKSFIHFLGLGRDARFLLQPGDESRRKSRHRRRRRSGGDRARLAASRPVPAARRAVRLASPDRAPV